MPCPAKKKREGLLRTPTETLLVKAKNTSQKWCIIHLLLVSRRSIYYSFVADCVSVVALTASPIC